MSKSERKKAQAQENQMFRAKYQPISKNEHEILMDELYDKSKSPMANNSNEKAFDFSSINDYNSIFKYRSSNQLLRQNAMVDYESKPAQGVEKLINLTIIGLFYLLFIVLFPFSLLICLKKIKPNEKIIVYRLGRIISPSYKPGYCILFPLIDNYQRFNTALKEFTLPNLQILNYENSIVETTLQVRYQINDAIKMTNSVKDVTFSLKSLARSILVSMLSKKDATKIEKDLTFIKHELKNMLNEEVRKWGIEVTEIELIVNSIFKDENSESNEDPALKSISMVFKSLFNSSSSSSSSTEATGSKPGTSGTADQQAPLFSHDFLKILSNISPISIPSDQLLQNLDVTPEGAVAMQQQFMAAAAAASTQSQQQQQQPGNSASFNGLSPFQLLKLFEPLINEQVVREVQTVYEFHLNIKQNDGGNKSTLNGSKVEVFHLDLKYSPKGHIGFGPYLMSKADCIIKMTDEDLNELLTDKLKPFTAYMSGRIEIDGDLQDVFKLKKLIKSITTILNSMKK